MSSQPHEQSVAPTTTTQEDLTTAGQRRVNLIWESTQAAIAVIVIVANMITCVYMVIHRVPVGDYPPVLTAVLFSVIGAYFSRTNHTAIGGTGWKATEGPLSRR